MAALEDRQAAHADQSKQLEAADSALKHTLQAASSWIEVVHSSEPALCDKDIMTAIEEVCFDSNLKATQLPSRASHDAQCFTNCPMGMIFVPSVNGISHSPEEYTTDEQCENGARVLIETIRKMDYNP